MIRYKVKLSVCRVKSHVIAVYVSISFLNVLCLSYLYEYCSVNLLVISKNMCQSHKKSLPFLLKVISASMNSFASLDNCGGLYWLCLKCIRSWWLWCPQSAITWWPKSVHAMLIVTLSDAGGALNPPVVAARRRPPGAGRTACRIAAATRICDANWCARRSAPLCFAPYLLQPP